MSTTTTLLTNAIKASKVPAQKLGGEFHYQATPRFNKGVHTLTLEVLDSLLKEFRPADATNGIVRFDLNGYTGYTHFSEKSRVCKFDGDFNGIVAIVFTSCTNTTTVVTNSRL